jgi:hypothetical protein
MITAPRSELFRTNPGRTLKIMAETTQNYDNHVRNHPPFHYFLVPLLLLNFIFAIVQLVRFHDLDRVAGLLLAFGFMVIALLARVNALRVQDRVSRLEEQLRYARVLPADLATRAQGLRVGQMVALRFASDEELPALVQQTLDGQFAKTDDIKRAIKNWRPDHLRV